MFGHPIKAAATAFALVVGAAPQAFAEDVSITNFYSVTDGKVYRSGKPAPEEIAQLKALGIKTVLSLETYMADPDEGDAEEQAVLEAGMTFVRVPMSPFPFEPPTIEQIQAALDAIEAPDNQPALVHCYHGSDRTGIVIGAYHIRVDGWTADEAIADMPNYGHSWLFYDWDELLYQF